jgi:hypothetical protein
MKLLHIAAFKTIVVVVTLIVGTNPFRETLADENFCPRIGLKSEAVVRNDLKQIGLHVTDITLVGEMAAVRIPVKGKAANIEVDRRTGTVRIIEASPIQRQFIKSRVPKVQLLTTRN